MLRRDPKRQARKLVAEGTDLLDVNPSAASDRFREALALDPESAPAWFDLALVHKWDRNWVEAFECGLRAAELYGEVEGEPSWWNLGIAATALRRWDVARRAWRVYGVRLPDGVGPIEADLGLGPVRIDPQGASEVVWGLRIDPARVRLVSIPFPESGHRWADIVLHDGVPNGSRSLDGESLPVFDELERWEPSGVPTVQASVNAPDDSDVDELLHAVEQAGFAAEDWTRNVRRLCKRCSEGAAHAEHSDSALATGREHLLGMAAPRDDVAGMVEAWAGAGPGRDCHALDVAL